MIDHINKLIYIHIPKTGGTSLKKAIYGYYPKGDHQKWGVVKEVSAATWDTYFKFSFVRNPWDWVYSIYSFYRMGKKYTLVEANVLPDTFEEFIYDLDKYLDILGLNINQCDFIGDELDHIGRFETINDDFKFIMEKLGMNGLKLPHIRQSKRNVDYHEVYNDDMVEIVRNKFTKDIEKFGYEF